VLFIRACFQLQLQRASAAKIRKNRENGPVPRPWFATEHPVPKVKCVTNCSGSIKKKQVLRWKSTFRAHVKTQQVFPTSRHYSEEYKLVNSFALKVLRNKVLKCINEVVRSIAKNIPYTTHLVDGN